ncbi:hypothetical protein CONLIGDRAFT_695505 [Coniochaeta ligniaria NRRL 30616]|uniref:Uncharacterized protein n=1 Tax=Coniochaeta ligniaria NRRL 30616 TaxID=1408157 RepID=A0A1J7J0V5_9PEZI|nr:hypothetical protein CONLIGDRAFT_695505 [Coniochaeta ligniaria NRRL 30616]
MHSLVTFLSALAGLSCLSKHAVANVIGRQASDLPSGWCCNARCDVCHADYHCLPPLYDDCDHLIGTSICCMLERKVDASGTEKFYTTVTGKEVQFETSENSTTA